MSAQFTTDEFTTVLDDNTAVELDVHNQDRLTIWYQAWPGSSRQISLSSQAEDRLLSTLLARKAAREAS